MMEENNKVEEYAEEESHPGKAFLILGTIALVIAVLCTFEFFRVINFDAFHAGDDNGAKFGAALATMLFLPLVFIGEGITAFLSVLFSTISFVKYKKSIARIAVFALSIINVLTFGITIIVVANG